MIIIACATDDKKRFTDKHFGDACHYLIYKIDKDHCEYLKEIDNNVGEERFHGDPVKAKGISNILSRENVQVLLSKRFGPNIVRMKKSFLTVSVKTNEIEEGLKTVMKNFDKIIDEWNKGEDRGYIILR